MPDQPPTQEFGAAVYVRPALEFRSDARVYRLNPPLEYTDGPTGRAMTARTVAVSAIDDDRLRETFIFPCDEDGNAIDMGELPGSIRGVADHSAALSSAGYAVIKEVEQ